MNTAIYSRKSKISESGDSVENQIQYCKDYANVHFKDSKYTIYEDEGYTAANTDRPEFQKMMEDIKKGKIDILICYRLDRISRSVSDFSTTLNLLDKYDVAFVSASEHFDTSTPMGKAMIYIASVFAQLEREMIAERIRDNMLALSKTGRWLGGRTPMGYVSKEEVFLDSDLKERKLYSLVQDAKEMKITRMLFAKYLEVQSLSQVEYHCLKNKIQTQTGSDFYKGSIAIILENPVYCVADEAAYNYFKNLGCEICNDKIEFDGTKALMCYNRTNQANNKSVNRPPNEWIIAIGTHKGIISGVDYVKIQGIIEANKSKGNIRSETSNIAALSGLITCNECGSKMRIKSASRRNGRLQFYYVCEMKVLSKGTRCTMKNISGVKFDRIVISTLKKILSDPNKGTLKKYLKDKGNLLTERAQSEEIKTLEEAYNENIKAIDNLVMQLSKSASSIVADYITPKLEELHNKQLELEVQIARAKDTESYIASKKENIDLIHDNLLNFTTLIDDADFNLKKFLLRSIIRNIAWDGSNADIELHEYDSQYGKHCRGH